MAHVILFHSAYGLRPAVLAQAQALRDAGHQVVTPDYYDGAVFDTLEPGLALRDQVGWPGLLARAEFARAEQAVAGPPEGQVLAGWSLGGGLAAELAVRSGAAGLLLFGCELPEEYAARLSIPVQIHAARGDEWVDEDEVAAAARHGAEVFRYGGGHIFADPDLPDYDAASAQLLHDCVLAFLRRT
jgi:dienelactone hydrolase